LVDSKCFQIKIITNKFFPSLKPRDHLEPNLVIIVLGIFASQGLRFGSPFSPPLADLEYILKFARNAT
jgi:hypothetical protein